ncbi:MAG: InlB B-repeat-containing protein, partial [Oscillospiraceae bacterium]|nr:InlB B-repeat-containing protein [Oscillospiraceae bacterium]
MKKRLLSVALVIVMLLSLLPAVALAEGETLKIVYDLTNYSGDVTEGFTVGETTYTPVPGEITTFTLNPDDTPTGYVRYPDGASPWCWEVTGVKEEYAERNESNGRFYANCDTGRYLYANAGYTRYYGSFTSAQILETLDGDTLTIKFVRLTDTYTVTAASNDEAKGTATSEVVNAAQYKLTATPNEGYVFLYWVKDGTENQSTSNPVTVAATEDASYTAYFAQQATATVSVAEGCEEMGTVSASSGSGNGWQLGASLTNSSSYYFLYWINDNTGEHLTDQYPYVILTEDTHFTAYFKEKVVTAAVAEGQEEMGTASITPNGSWYNFTATPNDGYAFDYWEAPDGEQYKQNPYNVYVGTDATYIAHFKVAKVTVNIDLTAYEGEISGAFTVAGEAYPLEAGKTYSFTLNGSDVISDDVVTFAACDLATNWVVDGLYQQGRGDGYNYYRITNSYPYKYLYFTTDTMYWQNSPTAAELTTAATGDAINITYVPTLPQYSMTIVNAEGQEDWGTVTAEFKGYWNYDAAQGDLYRATVTPAEGKYFWYMLKDGLEDNANNRLTFMWGNNSFQVTEDSTYTAHFRDLFTATAQVAEGQESMGTVESRVEYVGASWDRIYLTATPAHGYVFDYWELNGENVYSDPNASFNIEADGNNYIAHFKAMELTGVEGVTGGIFNSPVKPSTEIRWNTSPVASGKPYVGGRAGVYIPFSINGNISVDQITVTLADSDGTELSVTDVTGSYTSLTAQRYGYVTGAMIDPFTADYAAVTATLKLVKDGEVIGSLTEEYTTEYLDAAEENNDFSYKNFDARGCYYAFIGEASPILHGAYSQVNEATGELEVYAFGTGVYKLTDGADTDFVEVGGSFASPGCDDFGNNTNGTFGLGPDGEGGLIAVTWWDKSDETVSGLWQYDKSSDTWTAVEGSSCMDIMWSSNFNVNYGALVMNKNDVWMYRYHWDGTSWTQHDYYFNSFTRVSDTEAYATDTSGSRYRYDGESWTQVEALSAPSTESLAGMTIYGTYQDHNGDWYALTYGRSHRSTDTFSGSNSPGTSVFKWDGDQWVYQIISEFNDPNDCTDESQGRIRPDGPGCMQVIGDGVTALYGKFYTGTGNSNFQGGFYLYTADRTITFDTNGGSEIDPISFPMLTKTSPPAASPTKDGYIFAGWYTSNQAIAQNAPSYKWGLMPAVDFTLYARWVEDNGEDPFAEEKEQALASLDTTYNKLDKDDYDADTWAQIEELYTSGKENIQNANTYDGVYAALNEAVDAIGVLARQTSGIITVAVTVEKFTIDGEYIIEPTLVTANKFEQASVVLTDLLKEQFADMIPVDGGYNGNPYRLGPSCTETDGFYLAGIYYYNDEGDVVSLSEFDGGTDSGWEYCVNGEFPGVGAASWMLENKDVMRWQYTCVGYGTDIGNGYGGTAVQVADKDALIWKIAEINAAGEQDEYPAYADAMAVLKDIPASQEAVDAALAALVKAQPAGPAAQIVSASLTLAGDIGVNFFVIPNDELLADEGAYAQLTAKGETGEPIMLADLTPDNDGRFCFTQFVAAKEMTEQITLAIFTGEDEAVVLTDAAGSASDGVYSVARFVKAAGEFGSEKLQALAAKLASYGAYAKAYFEYEPVA